jgi:hypothetical protein
MWGRGGGGSGLVMASGGGSGEFWRRGGSDVNVGLSVEGEEKREGRRKGGGTVIVEEREGRRKEGGGRDCDFCYIKWRAH